LVEPAGIKIFAAVKQVCLVSGMARPCTWRAMPLEIV
jgi:hypothetical protein